jgi:ubiquinone/menaquinone biosynthesis C-methylase UbiE
MSESSIDQREYYNQQAEGFDAGNFIIHRANRNHYKKIDEIINLLSCGKNGNLYGPLLEVGMGTGIHAHRLLQHYPNVNYVGCDLSESMVHIAKSRLSESAQANCDVIAANGERLPFKNDTFRGVFISGSLHHFPNPFCGLKEAVRVACSGGRIVVMEPNWLFPTNLLPAICNKYERNILKMQRRNFKKWFQQLGVEDILIRNYMYTPPIPHGFSRYYDRLDDAMAKIPLVSRCSIMIYASATKLLEG